MKHILIICCVLMLAIPASAQQPDKALVKVQYAFSHVQDTTNRANPYTETMLLFAGKNASEYLSYDRISERLRLSQIARDLMKNSPGQTRFVVPGSSGVKKTSETEYYFFAKEQKFISKESLTFRYLVEEPSPVIPWKILKDTLSFSGIHCVKATAAFRGRNWTAWFAPDMPFQAGPWKLNGLPGLIIEAYDDKKEVQFKFDGLEKVKEGETVAENPYTLPDANIILPVTDGGLPVAKVTRKEFDKLLAAYAKDPQGFRNAQFAAIGREAPPMGGGGGSGGGGSSMVGGNTSSNQPTQIKTSTPEPVKAMNNPIELPER